MTAPNQMCRQCGCQTAPGYDICPKCRSEGGCEYFGYKQMSISVPWCMLHDRRIVIRNGLLCDECKEG